MENNFSDITVLIVDDNEPFRQVLKSLLEINFNIKVSEAQHPVEAFELLEKNIPSLIIMDVEMPYMDGFTAIKKIHENPALKNIPIALCTVLNESNLASKLEELNIKDLIPKNSDVKELTQKFEDIFSGIANGTYNLNNNDNE